jgi:hypothetical protein
MKQPSTGKEKVLKPMEINGVAVYMRYMDAPAKLTTLRRFILTTSRRCKLTT